MPPIGFNISHDHDVVSLAIRRTVDISIARNIGIDIMLAQLPEGETFSSFVESISIGVRILK
jgi:phosphopantetheinyl transferase